MSKDDNNHATPAVPHPGEGVPATRAEPKKGRGKSGEPHGKGKAKGKTK